MSEILSKMPLGLGDIAHSALDRLLPPQLQFLGGAIGGAIDVATGNEIGAIKNALDMVLDLKDLAQSQNATGAKPDPTAQTRCWCYEPSPPPPRRVLHQAAPERPAPTGGWQGGPHPAAPERSAPTGGWRGGPYQAAPERSAPTGGWRGGSHPAIPASTFRGTPPPAATPPSSHPPASTPAPTSGPAWSLTLAPVSVPPQAMPTASSPSSADASSLSRSTFLNLSDDDFMKAIRDGKIPKEVSDSKDAMLALQARMDHIGEMNQLMTSMLQALHQMHMAVIQNVRV